MYMRNASGLEDQILLIKYEHPGFVEKLRPDFYPKK